MIKSTFEEPCGLLSLSLNEMELPYPPSTRAGYVVCFQTLREGDTWVILSFGTSVTPGSSKAGLLLSAMPNPSPFYRRNELWTSLIYLCFHTGTH